MGGIKYAFFWLVAYWTRYVQDQRRVICITGQSIVGYEAGLILKKKEAGSAFWLTSVVLVGLCVIYMNLLLKRRGRHLPSGLARAKFVRLGYLRKMAQLGERIRRCQEMPEEAFGDPTKALHLLMVSHRWLNPCTCDVVTEVFPLGLKLGTLLL